MDKKHLTQVFPWLRPLRKKQRLFFFYTKMRLDGSRYAAARSEIPLPYAIFEASSPLYNQATGCDMLYQQNKVFNLKLAAASLNGIIIRPGETFSFWKLVRYADRHTPYKDGLTVIDGKLTTIQGGGMCQMSGLLFWLFLHTPLTIKERHGHEVKRFPDPPGSAPAGTDATVTEGWLDLKVKNETDAAFQIDLTFNKEHLTGRIFSDREDEFYYEITTGQPVLCRVGDKLIEKIDVWQKMISNETGACVCTTLLYRNQSEIGYSLPSADIAQNE